MKKMKKYKILTLEAREAYEIDRRGTDFHIYKEDGELNFRRFNSFLHNSLELKHIQNAFENAKNSKRLKGKFVVGAHLSGDEKYEATLAVVNVVFNSDDKAYSKKKHKDIGYVYVLKGEEVNFERDLVDHIYVKNGELVAIEVPYETKKTGYQLEKYGEVTNPANKNLLGGYFCYDEEQKCYCKTSKKLPTLMSRNELREYVYENGFTVHGDFPVKYVRYKRSAGSSRQGNCLFIMEPLYKEMMKWSACGLDLDKVKDQISKESYISLTLSNMEQEIDIPLSSILFIPDAVSTFDSRVVSVGKDKNGKVTAKPDTVTVENTIWDGQGLLDTSVFEANGYSHKGMMLLRNRFFKSCTFNTNLQAWFRDNGIVSLDQLNDRAYTEAKSIEDIKLVVTDSSLKYIKLCGKGREESIKQWLQNADSIFGLVKTEKPTKHFNGRKVQASYQLINSLNLNKDEVSDLLRPSLEYLWNIQSNPTFMRYYINMQLNEDPIAEEDYVGISQEDEEDAKELMGLRKGVITKLLSLNDRFAKTKAYSEFRGQIKKSIVREIRNGHILVNGTNATLFGNGYEMLCAIIDKEFDYKSPKEKALQGNQIRISRFADGQSLLCARSPHITMGNLYIVENSFGKDDPYTKYFNLTKEIVCVNSIGQNLLQRLNGCDFDSDTMLITDNEIMLNAAKKHYDSFLVPYCSESATPKLQNLWEMDRDISNNKIGNIVNLSQWLNSIYWDKYNKGEDANELYYEICKLAVLSGIEIDKAKRDYGIDAQQVLKEVKQKCIGKDDKKPKFFKHTKSKNNRNVSDDNYTSNIVTAMQLIDNEVTSVISRSPRNNTPLNISDLLPTYEGEINDNDYTYRRQIVVELTLNSISLSHKRGMMFRLFDDEKEMMMQECHAIELDCANFVKRKMKNEGVLRLLVKSIDDEKGDARKIRSLLLSTICTANTNFYKLIADTREDMYELVEDENGEYEIYGIRFKEVLTKRAI